MSSGSTETEPTLSLPKIVNNDILLLPYPRGSNVGVHERLTTVVSTKGQVILPKAIRDRRQWPSGTRVTVEDTPDGVLLRLNRVFAETSIDQVFASMPFAGAPLSIEDMNTAIAREARKHARD